MAPSFLPPKQHQFSKKKALVQIFWVCCSFIEYMTDQEYIHIAQQRREELYRYALRYTGSGDSAWDATQDALVTLWMHREEISPALAKGYLIRVMYRQLVDDHRREQLFKGKMPLLVGDTLWAQHDNWELHDQLQQALAQLTEQQRAVILLKDLEGYQYKEIAQLTGLEEPQVAGLLYRARVNLKKIIIAIK